MKKKNINEKGISLIVLVITIIVVVIIAASVILTLTGNNPIESARKATFLSDVEAFKNELDLYQTNEYAKNMGDYTPALLEATKDSLLYNAEQVEANGNIGVPIPSLSKHKKYEGEFEVINGSLAYVGTNEERAKWAQESAGILATSAKPSIVFTPMSMLPVKPGTDVKYSMTILASVNLNAIDLTNKIKVINSSNQELTNAVTVGTLTGTDKEKTGTVTITTTGLAEGKYKIKLLANSISTVVNTKNAEIISEKEFEIDNTAPAMPNIELNPSTWTNGNITATLTKSNEADTLEYSTNGTTWTAYTAPMTVTSNLTLYARETDGANNVSNVATQVISIIDKTAPTVTATNGGGTITSIKINATASDTGGSGLKASAYEYSKDNGATWTAPMSAATYTYTGMSSGTYPCKVRVTDNAGNVATSAAVNITIAAGVVTNYTNNGYAPTVGSLLTDTGANGGFVVAIGKTNPLYVTAEFVNLTASTYKVIVTCNTPSSDGLTYTGSYIYNYGTVTTAEIKEGITSISGFSSCSSLSSITFPSTLTTIDSSAFSSCTGLTSITIPSSVTTIGTSAFNSCTGLTSITIPSSVITIGSSAFSSCSNLTSVTIPSSVTSLSGFNSCSNLTSVTIQNGVTTIEGNAFSSCAKLANVTIPSSVTSIASTSFYGCALLTNITVDSGNANYSSRDGVLYNKNQTTLICYPKGKTTNNVASALSGVTTIGDYAFYNNTYITSAVIPNSVTNIGYQAFINCTSITNVTIPSSVTTIGTYVFYSCTGLTSITVQNSSIGQFQFAYCAGLTSITIPSNITSINERAFYQCNSLTNIIVDSGNVNYSSRDGVLYNKNQTTLICYPNGKTTNNVASALSGVITIEDYAFMFNTYITSAVIPSSVTTIGAYSFYACSNLTSITIPNSVKTIKNLAFYCIGITSVTIPSSVTTIGTQVFGDCNSLTSISVQNSIIGQYEFYHCDNLVSITIPNNVNVIEDLAFYACPKLTSVTIPSSVTSLGYRAFYVCNTLSNITVDSGNANYSSRDGVLYNKAQTTLICYPKGKTTNNVASALSGVTTIGDCAFYNNTYITSAVIPSSVTNIGVTAFSSCTGLTSLTISSSATTIGSSAFSSCSGLTTVTIPSSVTNLGDSAFSSCTNLTRINVTKPAGSLQRSPWGAYKKGTVVWN